jgi:hypothetical protein
LRGRLLLLNILLLALIGLAGWKLRLNWVEARAREQALLRLRLPALPAPQVLLPPPHAPVMAADYLDIAAKLLLSRDRNPNVVVEQVKTKPVPPFPGFYGVMDFGEGPSVVLAERGKPDSQRSYRIGQKIGEFKLAAVEPTGLTFEWDGKKIKATFDELRDKAAAEPPPPPAPARTAKGQSQAPPPPVTAVSAVSEVAPSKPGRPGVDVGAGTKACVVGDTSPAGTVSDGFRKVVAQTPFGSACRWEPVK